jgi:hypothetical protein
VNIQNFEQNVNPIIVSRGLEYFQDKRVEHIEDVGDYLYAATVAGSDDYSVEVQLDQDGTIIHVECDCPYTDGPYCKHMVAVFYTLRAGKKQNEAKFSPATGSPTISSRSSNELAKLLSKQPKEKLLKLLVSLAADWPEIADRIQAEFAAGFGEKERWLTLMRRFIEKAMDHDGFINYRHCDQAVEGAYQVLERANTAIDEHDYVLAVDLLLGIMAEMVDMLQFADDSSGCVGAVIDEVNSAFHQINDEMTDKNTMEICFQKVLLEAATKRYDDWSDMRFNLLAICADLVTSNQERGQLEKVFDTVSHSSRYDKESVVLLRHDLIRKFDGEQAAAQFLYHNRHFSRCREILLQEAMRTKQYAMAEELALEGEQQNPSLPGLVSQWKERRFAIYELCGETDKLRTVAHELAIQGDFTYYQKLKASYEPKEWGQVYPDIHQALSLHSGYYANTYTAALIEEREFDKLLAYVQKIPQRILDFYRQLLPLYQEQVYELFRQLILAGAANASSRSHYKNVCSHLRLLIKIGGKKIAADLVEQLLRQYPRKPAFRQELQGVKI